MKVSFLFSIGLGVIFVFASFLMWLGLDLLHVWSNVEDLLKTLGSPKFLKLMEFFRLGRVLSLSMIVAVLNVFLLTALSTVGAFLYNIICALVGGITVTFSNEQ